MRLPTWTALSAVGLLLTSAANAQIVYGTDSATDDENFRLDLGTMTSAGPLFRGQECYGLATDDANSILYASEEGDVFGWSYGSLSLPTLAVSPVDPSNMNSIRSEAMAYVGGRLYTVDEFGAAGTEGMYTVDLVTGDATPVLIYANTDLDIGGLDIHVPTGLFYGGSDAAAARGVVQLNVISQLETILSPYPGTISDVDGIAVNPAGQVYLIQDEPQPIDVYDLATASYTGTLPNAVPAPRVFSAGSWSDVLADPLTRIGQNFCGPAVANSTGVPGNIHATGSDVAADNDVTLHATELPPNSNGFFVVSQDTQLVPMAGGGAGTLCIGSFTIGRYDTSVLNADAAGEVELAIDLTLTPLAPGGPVAVMAGETWNWQYWHRDMDGMGMTTSNFTDALAITFN